MRSLFRKLFGLYPGEEKQAALFALLSFLWAFGVTLGSKFADALFLLRVGAESLPLAYTLTACCLLGAASFLMYAYHSITPYRILLSVILLGALFYSLVYICVLLNIGQGTQTLWFTLKVVGYLLFAVTITCFWLFVDEYYQLQDAKRLYAVFTACIFLGVATTGFIMRAGILELDYLFLVIAILLLITAYSVVFIAKKVPTVHDEGAMEIGVSTEHQSLRFLLKSIFTSRFTLFLMVGNFLTQLLMVITEFNYMSAFQEYFQARGTFSPTEDTEAGLTLFLGQWLATVSVTNLFFGLFLYSRFVRRFGVSMLVVCTPCILIVAFSGQLMSPSLLFPILGLFVVEGTLIVIDDNNFSLLLNAVPTKVKPKIRVMIESFFEPIGMLVSGLLLTFAPFNSKTLGLVLSCLALGVGLGLRGQYLQALFRNLADHAIHFQRSLQSWLATMRPKEKKASEHHLLAILKLGDERAQLFACEGLLAFEDVHLLQKLLHFLDDADIPVKMQFLALVENTSFASEALLLDHLAAWIRDEHEPRLKAAVHFYLAKQGLLHPDKAIADLESADLQLKGAAILALKKSWAHQSPSNAAYHRTLAAQHLEMLLDSQNAEEVGMGLIILGAEPVPTNVEMLMPFLKNADIAIARKAAFSLSKIIDKQSFRHSQILISLLTFYSDSEMRQSLLKSLEKTLDSSLVWDFLAASIHFRPSERRLTEAMILKMGLRTVPVLLALTKDTHMHDRCRTIAGRILGQLALPQLQANLYDIIKIEIERASFYFYHHEMIPPEYPQLDLKILRSALFTAYQSAIDFIIQMLAAAGSIEDSELLSRSLRSRNPKVRGQVIETLEKTCDPQIFRLILPLVGDVPLEEKLHTYTREGRELLSLTALLDKMEQSASLADRLMAAALKHQLDLPNWRDSLRKQMNSNEETFHHFAYELLDT